MERISGVSDAVVCFNLGVRWLFYTWPPCVHRDVIVGKDLTMRLLKESTDDVCGFIPWKFAWVECVDIYRTKRICLYSDGHFQYIHKKKQTCLNCY